MLQRNQRRSSLSKSDKMRRAVAVLCTIVTLPAGVSAMLAQGGRWSAGLDVLTTFAPLLGAAATVCGALACRLLPRASRWRAVVALVATGGAVAAAGRIVPEYVRPIPRAAPAPHQLVLRVLSFNIWRSNAAPAEAVRAIAAADADIVLLQETDGAVGTAMRRLVALYPYQSPCLRRCGEMILSKRPFTEDRFRVLGADGRKTAPALLFARTTAPDGGPVTLLTLHYTWPLPGLGQEAQRRQLIDGLRFVNYDDLILAGDMNLTPWSFAMARQDAAAAPLVRHTRGLFSWPSYRAGGWHALMPPILPIDQIYAGPAWAQVRIERLPATSSDHYPVLVTLVRRPSRVIQSGPWIPGSS